MRFKTLRLTSIRNEPKETKFASSELELLQMVLELDIGRCASKGVGLEESGLNRHWAVCQRG